MRLPCAPHRSGPLPPWRVAAASHARRLGRGPLGHRGPTGPHGPCPGRPAALHGGGQAAAGPGSLKRLRPSDTTLIECRSVS